MTRWNSVVFRTVRLFNYIRSPQCCNIHHLTYYVHKGNLNYSHTVFHWDNEIVENWTIYALWRVYKDYFEFYCFTIVVINYYYWITHTKSQETFHTTFLDQSDKVKLQVFGCCWIVNILFCRICCWTLLSRQKALRANQTKF